VRVTWVNPIYTYTYIYMFKVKPILLKRLAKVCETKVYKSLAQVMDYWLYICAHTCTHTRTHLHTDTDIYAEIEGQAEPAQAAGESLRD